MTRVHVDLGARSYDVVVARGAVAELATVLAGRRRVAIVTQPRIDELHGAAIRHELDATGAAHSTFLIGDGEEHKTLATVEALSRAFARWGLLRRDAVVALGGGVVSDTAGFTASVYYRGVDMVQVPTSLLAMIDAAIGGKTGVNLAEGKNLVGAFHQPLAVLVDPGVLRTLPEREYRSGLGEVAKYALMGGGLVGLDAKALRARDSENLTAVVAACAAIKARYVEADEREQSGVRAVLNYGHTLGHALEIASGHAVLHGEAVAVGLVFAGHLAGTLERISPDGVQRHEAVVAQLGLPTRVPDGIRADELLSLMARDKKSAGTLTFMLQGPDGIERVDDPDPAAVAKALAVVGVEV